MRHKLFAVVFCAYLINFGGIILYLWAGEGTRAGLLGPSPSPRGLIQQPHYLYSLPLENSGQLMEPLDVAVGAKGLVYVTDLGSRTVKAFDSNGKLAFSFPRLPEEQAKIVYPYGLAIRENGNVLLTDAGTGAVYEFSSQGRLIGLLIGPGPDMRPGMLETDPKDNIYISDLESGLVKVYDPSGQLKFTIGGPQNPLNFPQGLVVDGLRLWIADAGNSSIKISSLDNRPLRRISGEENLVALRGLAKDNLGRILAADAMTGRIHVFDRTGQPLFSFGGMGQGEGKFLFPTGLVFHDNRLYIVDRGSQRVQVWGY